MIVIIDDIVLETHHYNIPMPVTAFMTGGGFIGTVILFYLIFCTLIELNNEHKWFAFRRESPFKG